MTLNLVRMDVGARRASGSVSQAAAAAAADLLKSSVGSSELGVRREKCHVDVRGQRSECADWLETTGLT